MSQHRSLKSTAKDKKQRSVLNRFERMKELKDKGKWQEGSSVFGLPKVKVTKIKFKKEKPKEAEEKKAAEEQQEATVTESTKSPEEKKGKPR